MAEKQVFNKENLSALLRLQADALDRGEVLEFEEGEILCFCFEKDNKNIAVMGTGFCHFYTSITLKPKPQLRKGLEMSIKPIDWDALPKVFAWDSDEKFALKGVLFLTNQLNERPFQVLVIDDGEFLFEEFKNISETDPRIQTTKTRLMTAEELNDIYHEFGKDFRYRINSLAPIFGFYNYSLGTKIESNEQYSTDRGKTWNKCEVVE